MPSTLEDLAGLAKKNSPDLLPTLAYAVLWLIVRWIFYKLLRSYFKTLPATSVLKNVGMQEKVLEESFAIIGALVATVLGFMAFRQSDRGTCGLMNTRGCFGEWPHGTDADVGGVRDPTGAIALYHNVELGWYLHYLIKHHLGMGMEDNLQMHLHHFSTITLLLISYLLNLHRAGVLVLSLLNISNPFLHVAKVVHYVEAKGDTLAFLAFAVAFFLSRIVAYPVVVLHATLIESWQVHPAYLDRARHLPVYLLANGLLLLLMVMQVQWMAGIVRLLLKAVGGSKAEFKKEGASVDYAKTKTKQGKAE
ncbi:hypothetical protein CHLRE_09g401100v5 [Chlamydomonas reinhardtii]|uniref:TLC domain-containing protein n=1 Tax=Chlamydomonas reinhardtii TaxID=3055 RepID=A0A2K3DCT3_CHLRE|nr:uncharacterized protein CHLRE_09g401100v5 [Chlamydomonas reinhardtii]PNW78342.1 hypothetical protein CHLRE_09g401100v5 [Chlamydomonas reinhardtii]